MAEKLKLEDAQVGETIGPYRYRVTREMAEYAASKEMGSSQWFSNDAPLDGPIAPSTLTDNDWGLAFMQKYTTGEVVHTKAQHHYITPPLIGKELIVTGVVSDRFNKRGKDFIVFETTTHDQDGREIVKSKNTLLISL